MRALYRILVPTITLVLGAALLIRPALAQGSAEEIKVVLGKSIVLDYPEDVTRISTSDPAVVDYVPVSTREILLHAKALGNATVVVWAKSGQRTFYNLLVELNLDPLRKLIRETFPNEQIQIGSSKDALAFTGTVSSTAVADRAVALASPLTKNVVNNMRVRSGPVERQIVLKVKFAEVNRNAVQNLAINLFSTGAANTPGRVTTGQFPSATPNTVSGRIGGALEGVSSQFNITDALNIFAFRPDLNLGTMINNLQQQGMLQILAEPNLVTSNGKEASFLVGGEFPVPVLQSGANSGITIQFREFGIRLSFNPTLTENNTLKMYVKPEVSTIDLNNAVTVSGFRIPALATRRIESNVELMPGQSFIIGGLIDDRSTDSFARMPGLASIPVLGALFRSREEQKSKTELLVMVTPEFIEPYNPGDPKTILGVPRTKLDSSMQIGGKAIEVSPPQNTVVSPDRLNKPDPLNKKPQQPASTAPAKKKK